MGQTKMDDKRRQQQLLSPRRSPLLPSPRAGLLFPALGVTAHLRPPLDRPRCRRGRRPMEDIRKQASKLREQVARQQQAGQCELHCAAGSGASQMGSCSGGLGAWRRTDDMRSSAHGWPRLTLVPLKRSPPAVVVAYFPPSSSLRAAPFWPSLSTGPCRRQAASDEGAD
ncbi:hypothetical protein PVAP13_2NG262106 [Panicum virgatum]|uniref:Uncharacterized protein n=1 Tax=Panicum virgatum TaxID=38727 RepID=A0A8T0VFL8_PANVG|nr:hypothetical protein PVAP13_2NG262106 [Panicum virgatum]